MIYTIDTKAESPESLLKIANKLKRLAAARKPKDRAIIAEAKKTDLSKFKIFK